MDHVYILILGHAHGLVDGCGLQKMLRFWAVPNDSKHTIFIDFDRFIRYRDVAISC